MRGCFARFTNRPIRNGIVPPACEKMKRMVGYLAVVPLKTRLAMARVVSVLDHRRRDTRHDIGAAIVQRRMRVDDRFAAIEFGKHGIEYGITEIRRAVAG